MGAYLLSVTAKPCCGLPADEERELGRLIHGDDPAVALDAKNKLVESNIAICFFIAKRYRGRGIEYDDLVGEAMIGLLVAAQEWDPDRGPRFSTMASVYVKHQIADSFINRANLVRLPAWVGTLNRKLSKSNAAGQSFEATEGQVACLALADRARGVASDTAMDNEGTSLSMVLMDQGGSPEFPVDDADEVDFLNYHMRRLDKQEQRILMMRCGFHGSKPMTLKAVGREFGFSRKYIRQVEQGAIRKLRSYCNPQERASA